MYRSSSRMVLTLCGLVLAVVILMLGMIVCETFLEAEQDYLTPYRNANGVVLEADKNSSVYKYFKNKQEYNTGLEISDRIIYNIINLNNRMNEVSIYGRAIFVDENMNLSMTRKEAFSYDRYSSKLLKGRLINSEDIFQEKKVAVISEVLADILFENENPIGKEIQFPVFTEEADIYNYERFEVVGVIASPDVEKDNAKEIKKYLAQDQDNPEMTAKMYEFNFYLPYSVKLINGTVEKNEKMTLVITSNKIGYKDISSSILEDSKTNINIKINEINNADTMYSRNAENIKSTQNIILFAVLLIFVISGVSITNTMLFSVKERVNEIGIRKAIGAFNVDIVGQFVFEGFIYGVLSSIIGIFISVTIATYLYLFLNGTIFNVERLVISKEAIILAIAASILVGVLSSIIPAIYSSKIKVADALKFE